MKDFAQFMKILVTEKYSEAEVIRLVMDNLNIHKESHSTKHSPKRKQSKFWKMIELHYAPKHASWLNAAEIEINVMDIECTGRRIGGMETLKHEVGAWTERRNEYKKKIELKFTRKMQMRKCQSIM